MKITLRKSGFVLGMSIAGVLVAAVVNAALTFNTTTVSSDGALTITAQGASTWDIGTGTLSIQTSNNGAITTGTGLFTVGGNLKIPGAYSLDVTSAGQLNLGTTTANAVRLASTNVTTTVAGPLAVTGTTTLSNNITVPAAYGLDVASAGQLNIGTTTANAVRLASTHVTTTVAGPLAVTGTTTLSNNVTVPAAYGLDTAAAGQLNIGTTTANAVRISRSNMMTTVAGPLTVRGWTTITTSNTATSTLIVGCIQMYATSTDSPGKLEFTTASTTGATGASFIPSWTFGTCP